MIYRLIYCNKNGDSARIDIIKGALTPVETIEGTDNPFLLSYKMDTSNKSGFFMTSSANISVYESGTFNIDNLKTSSETELKVEYYINEVLFWSGFIIPDFFSRNIGVPATIEMVASDRIGTLKGSTLSSLTQYVTMRDIAVACLAKTGLSLPLLTMADFGNNGQTNAFFKSLGLSGRLSDTKGRNISCYDILRSILVACDGKLLQQDGAWYIVNKFQHEQGSGNLFSSLTASTPYVEQSVPFSEVDTGARRTIVPVAATTGVYHEHGGNRPRPINYDFTQMLSGWTTVGGFNAIIGDKLIKQFTAGGSGGAIISIVPDNNITIKPYLINNNEYIRNINPKYIESSNIDIPYTGYGVININVDVNATGPAIAHPSRPSAFMRIAVVAVKGTTVKTLDHGGAFINMPSENPPVFAKEFERGTDFTNIRAVTSGMIVNGKLEIPEGDSFSNWKIKVRIYGSGGGYDVAFNSTIVKLSLGATDSPKGNIYKRNQGANFTSEYPVDTTIFGDYITNGLNGYFYNYSIDDTSSLFSAPDVLIQPKWTAHADANELPLLQHVARQRSRMFSIAHDLINASIDVEAFKPLSIFVDCNSKRYCIVSANFDFLRSKVEVEIEQISYASLEVREFIYSYFGDSDTGISSVGGISGGSTGTGTGGGMTAEQIEILNNLSSWWKLDSSDILYSDKNVKAPSFIGSLTGNADTATKLQTARTIAGVSFDGTANIAIPFANLSSKPTTLAGYGITNAYTKTEVDTALALKLNKSVFDDLFEKVEISTGVFAIKAKYTFFSIYGVSAYGPGTGGGSGGGSLSGLSDVMLTSLAANNLLQFNGTHWVNVPASSVGTPVSWGTTSNNTSPLTVSGTAKTVSLSGHLHTGVYEPVFTKNTAFNKNFGTASGTVAQGNDSRIINGQTAFGWGNHSAQNYFKSTYLRGSDVGASYDANNGDNPGGFVGSYYARNWLTNGAFTGYGGLITWKGSSGTGLKLQMQYDVGHLNPTGGRLAFRTSNSTTDNDSYTTWKELYHTGNLTSLSQLTDNIGVATHIANTSNPHSVTKAQVGLGNVDNTSDSVKNVLSATKLQTSRTIWGQSFDGTANVIGALTGVTNITASGTITVPNVSATTQITTKKITFQGAVNSGLIEWDDTNKAFKFNANIYSTGEISAYGIGSGGSGGGSYDRLDAWVDYDSTKSGWVLSAFLGVDLNTRVGNLEGGSALTVNTTGTGNAITSISKAGTVITATKGATFSLSSHVHTGVYEPVFSKNTAFNKNFGTTAGTVAQGNDSRIINGQTAFGWGNHSAQNYFKSTYLRAFVVGAEGYDANEANLTGGFVGSYYSSNWLTNRAFDGYGGLITWKGASGVGLKLQMQYDAGHSNPSGGRLAFRTSYNSSGEKFTNWKEIWHTGNLTSLSQLTDNIGVATHIANKSNPHSVTKAQVGLGNVNNTSDLNKPISTATQTALNLKVNKAGDTLTGNLTAPTFIGSLSGNASTATKLQTARTIWGQSFDGTGNVTGALSGATTGSFTSNVNIGGALNITGTVGYSEGIRIKGVNGISSIWFNAINDSQYDPKMYGLTVNSTGLCFRYGTGSTPSDIASISNSGNITASGEITAYVASDRRLKENIKPIISALDYINKLNPVSYNWNAKAKELNPMKSDSLDYGLIAQEVENVLPGVVHGIFDDKYKSIDYIKLIPIMIAAIKELKQKTDKL